ncbi:MAG: T9SS type A sorting domain-containing protein [Chitinophagaceae bacterium]|nr:T9SS type A sorting domain-containing protein [Chitinophagaceae bacterium]
MKQIYFVLALLSIACTVTMAQPTVPATPAACNANSCITNSNIDVCPPSSSTVVTNHRNGTYNRGNNGNNLGVGAIWRFRNIATVGGITINCEVVVDAISNAILSNMDDDAAVDQANVSIASFFAPRISPDQNLNGTNRRGYVQFTMNFFKNIVGTNNNTNADFATSVSLSNINYVHYDIDGNDAGNVNSGIAGSWFRETGLAKRVTASNPLIVANASTELVAYNYTDPVTTSWAGFAGTVCERDGVSRCAQVASSFSYNGALPGITFRMGYDYNAGGNVGMPVRQYGSRLGCFNFPQAVTLPVKLLSFTGSYHDNETGLKWETEAEESFSHYEIERGSNGSDFTTVGKVVAQPGGTAKKSYQYTDAVTGISGSVLYYRLKMVDIDGKFKYSNVIVIRRDTKTMNGISISPNPVVSGAGATIRMTAITPGKADVRVIDMMGKVVLQQQNRIAEGTNSISINNMNRLQTGTYTVQLIYNDESMNTKISIIK